MNSLIGFRKLNNVTALVLIFSFLLTARAFAGQCVGVFDAPVQIHSDDQNFASQGISGLPNVCGKQSCPENGVISTALTLPPFITTDSQLEVFQPLGSTTNLLVDFANEFADVQVGAFTTVEFGSHYAFYAIKKLTLEYNSTLILAPGDYWIESLQISTAARIKTKGGNVRLFVYNPLDTQYQNSINEDGSAQVLLVSWDQVNFNVGNTINASVYSAAGISAGYASYFSHALSASEFHLSQSVNIVGDPVLPELMLGLCSDYGPLPDADSDGLADDLDPDDDNDGILDTDAGTGSGGVGTEQNYNTVDDGTGRQVDTNQCTDAFSAGLQSYLAGGVIDFRYGSQLLNSPNLMLPASKISSPFWMPVPTCETGPCLASGVSAGKLPERPWPTMTGKQILHIPYNSVERLEATGSHQYSRMIVSALSELTLDSQGGEFVAGDMQVLYRAKLILTPGDYWFKSLQLNSGAEVIIEGAGTVRLYVQDKTFIAYYAKVNATPGENRTAKLLLVTGGDLHIDGQAEVNAWVSSDGNVSVAGDVTGGISASHITLGAFAHVTYDYPSLWLVDFSAHCDIDSDGEYDLFDEDRDGDGISNEYEKQLAFDPTDATSTPPDMDRDGIPDALDTDRDGDGIINEEDLFPEDSSEWFDLDGDGIGDNADSDRDGDNFNNDDEIAQGTDPNDATDYPDIISPTAQIAVLPSLTNAQAVSVSVLAADEYSGVKSVVLLNELTHEQVVMTLNDEVYQATVALGEGRNVLTVLVTDHWDNQTRINGTVNRDTIAPVLSIHAPQDNVSASLQLTFILAATDENSGLASVTAVNPAGKSVEVHEQNGEYQIPVSLSEGNNNFTFTAQDTAGNQTVLHHSIQADVTPPWFSDWDVPTLTNQSTAELSVRVTDQYSLVKNVSLTVNGEPITTSTTTTDNGLKVQATLTLQEGNNPVIVTADDALANRATVTANLNRDSTPPALMLNEPASLWQADNQYELTGTAEDANAGIASVTLAGVTLTLTEGAFRHTQTLVDGQNTVTVVATDLAENIAESSVQIGWDNTSPVLTLDQPQSLVTNNHQWTLTGTALDAQSGVAELTIEFADGRQQPVDVTDGTFAATLSLSEGKTDGVLILTDSVGHRTRQPFSAMLDQTAPEVSLALNGHPLTDGEQRYTNQAVHNIELQLQDDGAGLASVSVVLNSEEIDATVETADLSLTMSQGQNILTVTVTDAAGNQSQQSISIFLDQTPPTLTWLSDNSATNHADMKALWQVADDSGIASQQLRVNGRAVTVQAVDDHTEAAITLTEGQNTLSISATDLAGNTEEQTFVRFLDTTAPKLTLIDLPPITAQASITVSGQVQDSLSVNVVVNDQAASVNEQGAFSQVLALAEGKNSIVVQASDALGNLTQQTVSIISDVNGPEINTSAPSTTEEDSLTVTGRITDDYSAIDSIRLRNLTTGVSYVVNTSGEQFSAAVFLDEGVNTLEVIATDALGNNSTVTLTTERLVNGMQWRWLTTANQPTTEDSIVLEGLLQTDLPPSEFSTTIAGQATTVSVWSQGLYSIKSAHLPLTLGDNTFAVVATAANAELHDSIHIERIDTEVTETFVFELTVHSPADGLQIRGEYLIVSGEVKTDSQPELTINGESVALSTSVPYYRFSETLSVPQDQTSFEIEVQARLTDGTTQTETRTVYRDTHPPILSLNNALQPYSEPTLVLENPYTLSGTVSDTNFSSLTLNGHLLSVTPAGDDQYRFTTALSLPNNTATTVELIAQDSAGNRTAQSYVLKAERTVELNWLLPLQNSQLMTYGQPFDLQIVLQSSERTTTNRYQLRLVNDTDQSAGNWHDLTFTNGTASTNLTLESNEGDYHLEARVLNTKGERIASVAARALTVRAPATVPVELVKVQPEQGATLVDTKEGISLFFNQAIDPNLLGIAVYETAYGKTWVNQDAAGTEFFNAKGYQLVDVERDHEPVPLTWQLASDKKTVLVSLGREPAYSATMFVDVTYDGERFARSQYQTRALPTLVTMVVRDQYNREVPDLRVEFAGLTGTTNADGLVQFGYHAATQLVTGDYTLWINPHLLNSAYGETKVTVPIDGGRLNDLGFIPVSFLNPEIGASYLTSGQNHALLGDEVLLDLSDAQVTFPDGTTEGRVHVQFNTSGYNYPTHPFAEPSWLYSFQPLGIRLSGNAGIQLKFPKFQNSWAYLPDNGSLLLLVAVNPVTETIEPVGLAERQGRYARVLNPDAIQVLDQIGVIALPDEFQPILLQYQHKEINLTVMMTRLAELARQNEPEPTEVAQ